MFLERYGGDGCDCDDARMMALLLFVAMAMRMKNDFACIFLLLMMVIIMMMTLMTIETFLHMIVSTVMMASVMIIVILQCSSWRCDVFSLNFFPDVFLHCDCRMNVCGCMCMCRSCVWCGGMKYDGDACAFMKTCANAHFCVKLLRLYATCFCSGLLFYFVEVYFGLYFAAVDVPPSSSSQALATTP